MFQINEQTHVAIGPRVLCLVLAIACVPALAGDLPAGIAEVLASKTAALDTSQGIGTTMTEIGRRFLGTPYREHTLDQGESESLVVTFEGFDCVTLVETLLAMARVAHSGKPSPDDYAAQLLLIRYRHGTIDGYPSRLHYSCDWAFDNQAKGLVRDITAELGGTPFSKRIDFMTSHREAYRRLENDENYAAMRDVETHINARKRNYLPKARIQSVEAQIQDGDILLITSSVAGLDVAHLGIAIQTNGRLHLLHASSANRLVEISAKPLADYLADLKTRTGIIVMRPQNPGD